MKAEFAVHERVTVPTIRSVQGIILGFRATFSGVRYAVRFLDSAGNAIDGEYTQEAMREANPPPEIIRQQQDFDLAQTRESLRRELEPHIRRELRNAARRKSPRKRR